MPSKNDDRIITLLVREILKRRLAVFIGAGCSIACGLPSWKQLLENLVSKYNIQTKEENLLKLASRIERTIGRSNFVDVISDACRAPQKEHESVIHELLTELDVNLYITTNYDHLLEEAFRKKGVEPHVIYNDLDLSNLNPTAKTIVKLHGDIDIPSSIVCTERDYRKYKTEHRGFNDWLKSKATELTLLFLGTSFDDPRLVDADDHVIDFFGENKRNHVIILRKPSSVSGQEINFEAELEDFLDRCRSFESDRGILVLAIQRYEEIEDLLKGIKTRVHQLRIDEKQDLDQGSGLYRLRADHYEILDKKFSEHLDESVRKLCAEIAGPNYFPSFSKAKSKIDMLIVHLQDPPHKLSTETIIYGYLTLIDAFSATGRPEDMSKALEFYEKANSAALALSEGHELVLRVIRAKAKLSFINGDSQLALETLKNDNTPKGIFWRLSILIESDKLDDALKLIQEHYPIEPEWADVAARALIYRGNLEDAEALYEKFVSTPESFKDTHGLIRLHLQMAIAFFRRAISLEGNPHPFQVIPGRISHSADAACRKALAILDQIQKTHQFVDPNDDLLFAESLIAKMQILDLIGETAQALSIAKKLLYFRPIPRAAAEYIALRENPNNKDTMVALAELLSEDHSKEGWAWVMRTKLFAMAGRYEEAWDSLFKAKTQINGEEEKKELAWTASELGYSTDKSEIAAAVWEELIDQEDLFYKFLLSKHLFFQDKLDQAYDILQDLTKYSFSPSVQSEVLLLIARIHMKRNQWALAKDLLKQSVSKINHPLNLKALIYVGSKEKDDASILEAATKLEQIGFQDDESLEAKAQSAFNLGRYDLAIETWGIIYSNNRAPKNAIKLATVLRTKGEYEKALSILKEYVLDTDTPDLDSLQLYCIILEVTGNYTDAFRQLDSRFDNIKDHPELLAQHLNLAYRLNQEGRAHQSMQRLIELQRLGKVDRSLFGTSDIEEFKKTIEESRKRKEFAIEQYRIGRLPRILFCEIENKPYYLEWAVRTQELERRLDNPQTRLEYIVYSTNSFRMGLRDGKRDLVPILFPFEHQEIVIDLSALITLHQLNLLPVVEKQFKAIYYPLAFKWLWELDRPQYMHHQRSKELLYREIDDFIQKGKIGIIKLPSEQDENIFSRIIKLAKKEDIPIVTVWTKEEDWIGADNGSVIWVSQIVNMLYDSGRIGEDKYRESLSHLKGDQDPKEQSPYNKLQLAERLVFDKGAIEFLVENGLLDQLLTMGVKPVLENWTAFCFHQNVRELDFLEQVGKWQKDLEAAINASKVFRPFTHTVPDQHHGYCWGIIEATLNFCKERSLPLMADDRSMQMLSEPKWVGKQFGTDALLMGLFRQDKLTLDQYTRFFVQMVKWRYRFLVPDHRMLLYLAKQFKNRPLGSELTTISDYGRDCMEDIGLFLGPEMTEPPKPLGGVFYLKWIDQWVKMLCSVWIDNDFSTESRVGITRKVFMQAIPPSPKGLQPEIRELLGSSEETNVISAIIQFIVGSSKCLELSGLLQEAFSYYDIENDRQAELLREHFNLLVRISLSDDFKQRLLSNHALNKELSERNLSYEVYVKENILKKNLARLLVAYQGSMCIPEPSPFSDLIEEYRMTSTHINESDTEGEELLKGDEVPRGNVSVSVVDGSIFKITWPEEAKVEFTFAHEILNHPDTRIRMEAFQRLMAPDQLSEPTRMKCEGWKGQLTSDIKAHWEPVAYKMRQVVVKDFRYIRMHLKTALISRVSDNEILSDAIKNLLFPDLETAWAEAPAVIKSTEQNSKEFKQNITAAFKQAKNENSDEIENVLNQYMEQFGFVAFAPPLDAWSVLGEMRINAVESDQDAEHLCKTVNHWAYEQDDPLALVVAWEILLGSASNAGAVAYFKGSSFRKLLSRIFLDVAFPGYSTGNRKDNAKRKFFNNAWKARIHLARHYLRYIETKAINKTDDQQVLTAWWMAKKAMEAILESMEARGDDERATLLEKHIIPNWINEPTFTTHLLHSMFYMPKTVQSANRYCTFVAGHHLPAAMLAFIAPIDENSSALGYAGMSMTDEMRDGMIKLLEPPADFALAHLPEEQHAIAVFLWNRALNQSVPSFLHAYYKDNIELIGNKKMQLLQGAEIIARSDYPEEVIKELTKNTAKSLVLPALFAFNIVGLKLATEGMLTPTMKIMLEKPQIIRDLVALDESFGPLLTIPLVEMLPFLYVREEVNIARELEVQLLQVDWDLLSKCAASIIERVIVATLLSMRNDIFNKLVEIGRKNKRFNIELRTMRENLGDYLSKVPTSYRERVRYVLRELEAIPETSYRQELQ